MESPSIRPVPQRVSLDDLTTALKLSSSAPADAPIIRFGSTPKVQTDTEKKNVGIAGFFRKLSDLLRSIFRPEGHWQFNTELDGDELGLSSVSADDIFHEGGKLRFEYVTPPLIEDSPVLNNNLDGLLTQVYAQLYLKLTEPGLLTRHEQGNSHYNFNATNGTSITLTQTRNGVHMLGRTITDVIEVTSDGVTFDNLIPTLERTFAGHPGLLSAQREVINQHKKIIEDADKLEQDFLTEKAAEQRRVWEQRQRGNNFLPSIAACLAPKNIIRHLSQMFPDPAPFQETYQSTVDYDESINDCSEAIDGEEDYRSRSNDINKPDQTIHFDENTKLFMIKLYNEIKTYDPAKLKLGTSFTISIDGLPPIKLEQKQKEYKVSSPQRSDYVPIHDDYVVITVGKQTREVKTSLSAFLDSLNGLNKDSLDFKAAALLDRLVTFLSAPATQPDASTLNSSQPVAVAPTLKNPLKDMLRGARTREIPVKDMPDQKAYEIEFNSEHGIPSLVMTPLAGNEVQIAFGDQNKHILDNTTVSALRDKLISQNRPSKKQ